MDIRQTSDSTTAVRRTVSRSSSTSSCGSSARKRSWPARMTGGYLTIGVVVVLIALQFSSPVWSASLNKRSTDQEEVCRTNAICGWEVYHPSSRNLQYYVASSCKCSPKETCIRSEDDISISAYVFRCRDSRRRKTTRRPSTDLNETS